MKRTESNRTAQPPREQFDPRTHRKLVKHSDIPGQAHELTFSCYKRRPLLADNRRCILLSTAIDRAITQQGFNLVAFVFMPEHVHLIVFPIGPHATISRLLFAIKRPVSWQLKQQLIQERNPLLAELTIRERPGRTTFRFWQEGGGYDRNIVKETTLRTAIDYVHNNPARRGLCDSPEQWKWSSWWSYSTPNGQTRPDLPTVHGWPV